MIFSHVLYQLSYLASLETARRWDSPGEDAPDVQGTSGHEARVYRTHAEV